MRIVLSATLAIALALPLLAGTTSPNPSQKQRALLEEMMEVIDMKKTETEIFDAIIGSMQEQFMAEVQGGDPAELEEAKWKFERFRHLLRNSDLHATTREMYIELYAKYLTESELADLIAFYRTPTGKKSIEIMPQLMAEAMQRSGAVLGPKIQAIVEQVEKEGDQRQPWKKTIRRIENIGMYLESHAQEHDGFYPEGEVDTLVELFEGEIEKEDMWGHELAYVLSNDRKRYRIVSAGADGIFDWDSRRIADKTDVRYRERLEDDIIYADGAFVQMPRIAAPKE